MQSTLVTLSLRQQRWGMRSSTAPQGTLDWRGGPLLALWHPLQWSAFQPLCKRGVSSGNHVHVCSHSWWWWKHLSTSIHLKGECLEWSSSKFIRQNGTWEPPPYTHSEGPEPHSTIALKTKNSNHTSGPYPMLPGELLKAARQFEPLPNCKCNLILIIIYEIENTVHKHIQVGYCVRL